MRILYISHLHPPENQPLENMGGMQRVSMQLERHLRENPEVTIDSWVLKAPWKGIAWQTTRFIIELISGISRRIKRFDADVALFSSMVTASTALIIRKFVDVPLVAITHGQDVTLPNKMYQTIVPHVFKRLDGVISVSRATREACISRGAAREKVVVLPNGFDDADKDIYPSFSEARRKLTESLELDLEGRHLLLTVGRMIKRKGHERFIREILPHISHNVLYLVIGDGPRMGEIRRAVSESGMEEKVYIAGRQPDQLLVQAYAAADLFIMPNIKVPGDMEGFGIVLLEANLAETPAVTSDLEGIKDVIKPGYNGYRVPEGENMGFADRIDRVIDEELDTLKQRSRAYVVERFNWRTVAGQYIDFLRKVVQKKGEKN